MSVHILCCKMKNHCYPMPDEISFGCPVDYCAEHCAHGCGAYTLAVGVSYHLATENGAFAGVENGLFPRECFLRGKLRMTRESYYATE